MRVQITARHREISNAVGARTEERMVPLAPPPGPGGQEEKQRVVAD